MTTFDNYINQTVEQFHGRPLQKRLRILWFICTAFLTALWLQLLRNHQIRYKKCFVR